ncbi:MAG: DUF433 domain-containing protein, partial [Isosphaeraceae bacterium]
MDLPEFLTRHEKGEIRLTGHRIDLFHVISQYNEGYSAETILDQYPTLNLPMIQDVIAFYRDNLADVDADMADVQARIDRFRAAYQAGPGIVRIRELLEAARPEESFQTAPGAAGGIDSARLLSRTMSSPGISTLTGGPESPETRDRISRVACRATAS